MKKSILSILIVSGILSASCTRNTDETVSCSDNKLMWQDNTEVKSNERTWDLAINYCKNSEFAGYNDWRLANINELLSIANITKSNPAINSVFSNVNSSGYWSSTTFASIPSYARGVNFSNGYDYWSHKTASHYVRCVRAGQ